MSETIRIIDVIHHQHKYGVQREIVIDRTPEFVFTRRGKWLIGHDAGLFKFFARGRCEAHWPSKWKAFGGDEFDIPMEDGTVIHASGQWWDDFPKDFKGLVYSSGMNTIDRLAKCHVFFGGWYIDCAILDEWMAVNKPSNNYHKYDQRHADHGKHEIVSPWAAAG